MKPLTEIIKFLEHVILILVALVIASSCSRHDDIPQPISPQKQPQAKVPVVAPDNLKSSSSEVAQQQRNSRTLQEINELCARVQEMGARRDIEAVPFLVSNLLDINPTFVSNAADFEEFYPCCKSLIAIGEPSIPEIQARFEKTKSDREKRVLLHALTQIKGKAWTAQFLDNVIQVATEPEAIKKLQDEKSWVQSK